MCHHPKDMEKEKAMCTWQVEFFAQSYFAMVCIDLDALKEKHESESKKLLA